MVQGAGLSTTLWPTLRHDAGEAPHRHYPTAYRHERLSEYDLTVVQHLDADRRGSCWNAIPMSKRKAPRAISASACSRAERIAVSLRSMHTYVARQGLMKLAA